MVDSKSIRIEFLYFDMSRCIRCQMSDVSLEASLKHLQDAVKEVGTNINVEKIAIGSDEEAKVRGMVTSPTIKINGKDIEEILYGVPRQTKSYCGSCSAVCNEETECRTFTYENKTYEYIPRNMIVEAIKKVINQNNL